MGIIIAFLIPILAEQVGTLQNQFPYLITRGGELLRESLRQYREQIPIDVDQFIAENTNRIVTEFSSTVQEGVKQTFNVVTTTISFIIGITIIPVWLFYVLLDEAHSKRMTLEMIPRPNRPDAISIYRIVDTTLGAYLRGQLILATSVWFFATAALLAIGVEPALLLGIVAGVLELLPNIGPILSLAIVTFIALLQSPGEGALDGDRFPHHPADREQFPRAPDRQQQRQAAPVADHPRHRGGQRDSRPVGHAADRAADSRPPRCGQVPLSAVF